MTHRWLALLIVAIFVGTAPAAFAQEADPDEVDDGEESDEPPVAAPEGPPPPPPDAPVGPPPPPPEETTYPVYPGQPAPGYDSNANGSEDDDVVPVGDAPAPTTDDDPHQRGFFLRPHVGFGYVNASGQGTEVRGLGVAGGIMIGGTVVKNLYLFGEFSFQLVDSANYDGPILLSAGETVGLASAIFGGGIGYYLMPFNLHAALSAGYLAMQVTVGDTALLANSSGFGMHLMLGKEWLLGRRLGIGVAAHSILGFANDYTLVGVGLAATLTFN